MFVSFYLLMVEAVLLASATVSPIKGSVRAARNAKSATPRFIKEWPRSWIREYHRRHYPNEPKRRCSIHNRPTCPFSADDGAYAGHRKGPRPVFYKINLSFRRFGCGTSQLTGSNGYYIGLPFRKTRRASSVLRAHGLVNSSYGIRTCDHRPLYHHQGPGRDHLFHD